MGNTRSIELLEVSKPLDHTWVKQSSLSYCDLYVNMKTKLHAELYTVAIKGSLMQQFELYEYRKQQDDNIVKVLSVSQLNNEYMCNALQKLKVVTQHIPHMLADMEDLSISDTFFILYEALIGFKIIFEKKGYIFINENLIGINELGEIKVWLNQNFAENQPVNFRTYNEADIILRQRMIQQLFITVEEHTLNKRYPQSFKQIIGKEYVMDFLQGINLVRDYCLDEDIQLPTHLQVGNLKIKSQPNIIMHIQSTSSRLNHSVYQNQQRSRPATVRTQPMNGSAVSQSNDNRSIGSLRNQQVGLRNYLYPNYESGLPQSQQFQAHENKFINKMNPPQSIGGMINPFEQITNKAQQPAVTNIQKTKNQQPFVIQKQQIQKVLTPVITRQFNSNHQPMDIEYKQNVNYQSNQNNQNNQNNNNNGIIKLQFSNNKVNMNSGQGPNSSQNYSNTKQIDDSKISYISNPSIINTLQNSNPFKYENQSNVNVNKPIQQFYTNFQQQNLIPSDNSNNNNNIRSYMTQPKVVFNNALQNPSLNLPSHLLNSSKEKPNKATTIHIQKKPVTQYFPSNSPKNRQNSSRKKEVSPTKQIEATKTRIQTNFIQNKNRNLNLQQQPIQNSRKYTRQIASPILSSQNSKMMTYEELRLKLLQEMQYMK